MKNIEKHAQNIYTQIIKNCIFKALRIFSTLSQIEKNKVSNKLKEEFDIDLAKTFPDPLITIGAIQIYQINNKVKILSTSTLGNEYLKILNSKKIIIIKKENIEC